MSGCVKDMSFKPGKSAPEISVLDLNDKTVKLSDFRGKVVMLRFWSTGCRVCVKGMPALNEFNKKYEDRGLVLLAVNKGESKERVEQFIRKLNISYPVLLDPALIAAAKYGVTAVPTTVFIDRKGTAGKVILGEMMEEFEKEAEELL